MAAGDGKESVIADHGSRHAVGFSLSRGGPTFRILRALHLSPDHGPGATRAAFLLAALSWLPLVILALMQGLATPGGVLIPLLWDPLVYARFLVATPLYVALCPVIDRVLGDAFHGLVASGIVPPGLRKDFDSALLEFERGREAWLPELLLLAGVFAAVWLGRDYGVHGHPDTWVFLEGPHRLSWAGYWLGFVSLPLAAFLALRWMWRIALWGRMLWRISRLDLALVPSHPDGVGGLGGLAEANAVMNLLIIPFAAILAANAAHRVVLYGETLLSMKLVLAAFLLAAAVVFHGPLLVFAPMLTRTRLLGLLAYNSIAGGYSRSFDRKWMGADASAAALAPRLEPATDEALLGSADIQSLADM